MSRFRGKCETIMGMVKMENVRNHWHRFGKYHLSILQMVNRGAGKGKDFRVTAACWVG